MSRRKEERYNLSNKAYEILKQKIVDFELEPGEPMKEVELSEHFNISRTPIRTAILKLKGEGLVEFVPVRGNIVSRLSVNKYIKIFQVRETMELLSVRLAGLNWENDDIRELEQNLETLYKLIDVTDENLVEFLNVDKEFHNILAKLSKNGILYKQLTLLNDHYYRYNYLANLQTRSVVSIQEHEEILKALESRDIKRAEDIMSKHLREIKDLTLISLFKQE